MRRRFCMNLDRQWQLLRPSDHCSSMGATKRMISDAEEPEANLTTTHGYTDVGSAATSRDNLQV
jgi:hypothetical protein